MNRSLCLNNLDDQVREGVGRRLEDLPTHRVTRAAIHLVLRDLRPAVAGPRCRNRSGCRRRLRLGGAARLGDPLLLNLGLLGLDLLPGRCNQLQEPIDLSLAVLEPVRAPDAMDDPASVFQHLLAQTIPIADGLHRVVRDTVAFNTADEPAGELLVQHPKVHAVAADADLRLDPDAALGELPTDIPLERSFRVSRG